MAFLFMGVSFLGVRGCEELRGDCGRMFPAWVGKLAEEGGWGGSEDGIAGVSLDRLRGTVLEVNNEGSVS